jgi:DNA-binding NarL/FixJ family response regulator
MRIVVAEDNMLLREGISRVLEDQGMEIVGRCETADALLEAVQAHRPDVAIVDIRLPPTHTDEGLRAAEEIRAGHPGTSVLVLSQYVDPDLAMRLVSDGVEGTGYLLKDRVADVEEFAGAVRRVAAGGTALDPSLVSMLLGRRRGDDPLERLTPREREVLELMAEGCSNQAIAERLTITLRAVEKHVTSIFGALGLPSTGLEHRRVLAVLTYLRS